ncbi:lipoxygenase homology domain-containing protein 1-like [Haliotis rufescens]|uniref:lipoxygenase homology domain-containing protein 1-like n=1 Tax=Haliotis rufescens TaxID=6454 RepID=UPI00201EE3A4|nr:lipoxygenase homology domain-containing protein 1-like [Haliotis rufescens]
MVTMRVFVVLLSLWVLTVAERRLIIGDMTKFQVTIATGSISHAGTHSHVFLAMTGDGGVTNDVNLNAENKHMFRQGQVDKVEVFAPSVGHLRSIRIRHDTHGDDPSWYIETITIEDGVGVYEFPCHCWLSTKHGSGSLSTTVKLYKYTPLPHNG